MREYINKTDNINNKKVADTIRLSMKFFKRKNYYIVVAKLIVADTG